MKNSEDNEHLPRGLKVVTRDGVRARILLDSDDTVDAALLLGDGFAAITDESQHIVGLIYPDGTVRRRTAGKSNHRPPEPVLPPRYYDAAQAWLVADADEGETGVSPQPTSLTYLFYHGQTCEPLLTKTFLEKAHTDNSAHVLIEVRGWPLLTLRPKQVLREDDFDWKDLQIRISGDFQKVGIELPSNEIWNAWDVTLRLPMVLAWLDKNSGMILRHDKSSSENIPLHTLENRKEDIRAERTEDETLELVIPSFQGGTVVLSREPVAESDPSR